MKNKKQKIVILIVTILIAGCCFRYAVSGCDHANTENEILSYPTCTEEGISGQRCLNCGELVSTEKVAVAEHKYGEDEILSEPSENKNGIKIQVCEECGYERRSAIICRHEITTSTTLKEPSCAEEGIASVKCEVCQSVFEENIKKLPHNEAVVNLKEATCSKKGIERMYCKTCGATEDRIIETSEHIYGNYYTNKHASPFETGEQYRICVTCGKKSIEEIAKVVMEDNSIYIPSAGIQCSFNIKNFNRNAINQEAVTYSEDAYSGGDYTNPFIIGNSKGELNSLYKTKIEQFVYICRDGEIETYKVMASEYAVDGGKTSVVGIITDVNVWDTYGSALSSEKTSIQTKHNGVDRMPEDNDGKTLHILTTHYGEDRMGYNPEIGRNGRWIVLADLVSTQTIDN